MSKHAKTWQENWFPVIAGGLVSGGAFGCCVYGGLRSKHFETIAASLAGGIGVYLASSAFLSVCCKSNNTESNPISFDYDPTSSISLDNETSVCERFANIVNELDRKFDLEARKTIDYERLDKKKLRSNIRYEAEEMIKPDDMVKKLNDLKDLNLEGPRNRVKLPTYRNTEISPIEDMGSLKAKFREELFSCISELKGYVQGTIDPLPSARKIQFRSTEMSDEMRGQAVMIVKEYANSMLPRLEQVIEEMVDSVSTSKKILEHKVKKASEISEVSDKDLSTANLKTEMEKFYSALESATKSKSQMPRQFRQQFEKGLEVNLQPLAPTSIPYFLEKIETKTSERSTPVLPNLKIPTTQGIPFMSTEETPGPSATEKIENPQPSVSVKLTLNSEEMNFLNLLKSEL